MISTIVSNEQALVVIDSDCDGFTSSAILLNYLYDFFPAWIQNKVNYILHDGKQHGLNDHVNDIIGTHYSLVIIPDAGSNDVLECTALKENGIKVIVLDHHLCDV